MAKKKKRFSLGEQYKVSWNFIKESKNFIYFVLGLFFLFFILGLIFPLPDSLQAQIIDYLKALLEQTQGKSLAGLIWFIFFNNLKASFGGILFGLFLGLFPVFVAMLNGYILGFVSALAIQSGGVLSLWRLFPHGIFELPAVFISLGIGVMLGINVFRQPKKIKMQLFNALRVFLFIVFPLLVVAAIIEGSFMFLVG